MATGAPIRMNMSRPRMSTDLHILTLTQWLSPAFPVGAFAYSHGVEVAIQNGVVTSSDSLRDWLRGVLRFGSGGNDCILLRAAYASDDLQLVNDTALAFAASSERLLETRLQGAAFAKTAAAIWGGEARDLCYPVAIGAAAARAGIDVDLTARMYLQAFASNLVSAAVRAVPLGQTEGQAVLAALTPDCIEIAQNTRDGTLDDLHSTAFLSDIASMTHETLQPRIFRS
ncbi:urease accessory UreF family protein [uncultured Litoreibacter sp.]|uniref:urease accessory protein UreF n=1 Tax=uncultured Litoreibacter sp. TaxID=1392394 RepID=UPI002631D2E9|nr:urease accessory UreF family protein [uncultured Litoreibacter sp.]